MKRTNIYLTIQEMQALHKIAKETGLSTSELIRRIIDEHLEEQQKSESPKQYSQPFKK